MAGGLLNNLQQLEISEQRRMPVDNIGADAIYSVAGEAVQFYYFNAGVLTVDAGQAAGTTIVAKLLYRNIKNSLGDVVGYANDTSLTWTTGTALTKLRPFPSIIAEGAERNEITLKKKADEIVDGFGQGEYCIDHRTGTIYGVKATAGTSDTAAYKVETTVSGGSGPASDVNLVKVAGTAVAAGSGAVTAGTQRVILATDDPAVALLTTIDADTSNLDVALSTVATETTLGSVQTAVELIDDSVYADEAAFTLGTSKGLAVFGQYTAAGDNVADGQTGVLAMTINRHLHVQADGYDSATDSQKVYEVAPLNSQYVEQSLVDTTNITAVAHYYPGDPATTGALVAAYKDFSFTGQLIDAAGITMVVQATNDEAPGASDWITVYGYRDDTNATVNSVGGAGTTTFSWSFNEFNYKYFRVVVTPVTGGTNTVIIKMRKKAL